MHSGKQSKKKEKPKPAVKPEPPKGPTESERLADILTRYGNNPEGIPALHYAILQSDTSAVDLLLKNGASPHTRDFHGADCIYYSVKAGNIQLVQKFLSLGVNPNGPVDMDQFKPLGLAIELKRNEIAKLLINSSVDFSTDSQYKADYLRYTCAYPNIEIAKFLIEKGVKSNNPDLLFKTLTIQMTQKVESLDARKLKMEMLDLLVREERININKKFEFHEKELPQLFPESLTYILRNGLHDFQGRGITHQLIAYVAQSPAYATELVSIALNNDLYTTQSNYLNSTAWQGMTAMHYLVQGTFLEDEAFAKRKQLIEQLVAKGADINRHTDRSKTPLDLALDPKMIDFLKKLKAMKGPNS